MVFMDVNGGVEAVEATCRIASCLPTHVGGVFVEGTRILSDTCHRYYCRVES